jgi:hypothetical protein
MTTPGQPDAPSTTSLATAHPAADTRDDPVAPPPEPEGADPFSPFAGSDIGSSLGMA